MIKIMLTCAAGMSTSMVVNKMRQAAEVKGIEAEIKAYSVSEFEDVVPNYDIVLVAPQVKYQFEAFNKRCVELGKMCGLIEMMDYGMMKGDKILDQAIALKA